MGFRRSDYGTGEVLADFAVDQSFQVIVGSGCFLTAVSADDSTHRLRQEVTVNCCDQRRVPLNVAVDQFGPVDG